MGTTVTSNLGLIKPDIAESIQQNLPTFNGWAAQSALNCDAIDALFRSNNNTYALTISTSGVAPTLGAGGFTEGKYIRLWPRMVLVYFRIFLGAAGLVVGSGEYRINLPFAFDPDVAASDGGGRLMPCGKCVFKDNSAVLTSSALLMSYSPIPARMVFGLSQGDVLDDTFVGQNDRLSGYFTYPTQAA